MIHTISLWPKLMQMYADPSQAGSKCISELAMALHYIRRDMPSDLLPLSDMQAAEAAVAERTTRDDWLRLGGNGFLIQQCATPYIFLRGQVPLSRFHEALIADLVQTDRSVRECTPYRRMERAWLLYKLARGRLPDWNDAPILTDARAAFAFNRDLSYAFTHTVFFCTDFAGVRRPDPTIKGLAMMIAAQSHAVSDVDLFLECCICLMSQELDGNELAGLLQLITDVRTRHAVLFEARRLAEEYHPLFVFDILRGLMLRWHGIDLETLSGTRASGPYAVLLSLARALCDKDAEAIMRALRLAEAQSGPQDWLRAMVRDRLSWLASLARHGALFEREFAVLQRRDDAIYPAYAAAVGDLLAELGPSRLAGVHPC